ncbi:MAG: GntR family transcriptional regulator [Pacificibacter sp.]|uniref:GntR family transcriptional regulator n=1 Tax=Pacificibacter sp. TaxID=1917866 RepID=UPI00321B11A5
MAQPENSTVKALKKSNVARYIQLASLFRNRIESGEWDVGDKIPNVEVLAKECGVATMTIRQSLDILQSEGLIERFRAKGTFVTERPNKDIWCEVKTDWTGLLIAQDNAVIEILDDKPNAQLPRRDGYTGNMAPSYRHLKRRHSRDGVPFLLANVFVDERVCKDIPESAYTTVTAMRLIADLPDQKITDAHQVVTIGAADLETSEALNISIGDPVAKVQRVAVNQVGDLILVANGVYRGDMMKISVKLR